MSMPEGRSGHEVARRDVVAELSDLQARMSTLMESVFAGSLGRGGSHAWLPSADVSENDDDYVVEVELPGVRREDMSIECSGTELVIGGEFTEKEKAGWFRTRTRRTGRFEYRTVLPRDIVADKITADLHAGVLTVTVPKSESAKPRRIEITTVDGS